MTARAFATRVLRSLLRLSFLLFGLVAAYFLVAWVLVFFPAGPREPVAGVAVNAWVLSNGVHTDLVFPIRSPGRDWSKVFPPAHFQKPPADADVIAIGWGDREFYLHTPHWRDLTAGRALQALSGSGRSLLHVTYLRQADLRSGAHALPLSADQYAQLMKHVDAALVRAADGAGLNLPGQHYGEDDAFYEAHGAYDLFTTCNVWTGRGLAQAGMKVSRWTPLASQVVWHLPPSP